MGSSGARRTSERPRTRLASLPVGDGRRASIWRYDDDGSILVSPGVPGFYGSVRMLPLDPALPDVHPVPDGVIATGELVTGAETVEVRAPVPPREIVTAAGHYIAMIPFAAALDEVLVAFRDADGNIVRHGEPGELKRVRIEDVDEACGACGGREWDHVEHRAPPHWSHTRVRTTVCATCGHRVGGTQSVGRRRRPLPDDAFDFETAFPDDAAPADIVAGMPFPVYGVANRGGTRRLDGYASEDVRPTSCRLRYRRTSRGKATSVVVDSGVEPHPRVDDEHRARGALANGLERFERAGPPGSLEATLVRRDAAAESARGRASRAPARAVAILVDGEPHEFACVEETETGTWGASTTVDGHELTITATGIAPEELELELVTDPTAHLGRYAQRT